ncbi:hypothetical protein F0225_16590 [Vibrio pectenicida]|uniref:IS110 family transposase n=1 Tax=Vibrio pectenicida TaxID=62763 RepID=A0A7Y4A1V5_9VIBR|nr:hypothetical protein [Vibrio pectenicida]NOH72938.1 hypothetical protein [Vibrio pectenicida]
MIITIYITFFNIKSTHAVALRNQWVTNTEARRGKNITAVAVANKNVRVAWALLSNKSTYQAKAA